MTKAIVTVENSDSLIKEFIISRHLSSNSQKTYRNALNQLKKYFSAKEIVSPTVASVDNFINNLREENKSVATIRLYTTTIKMFFAYLSRRGLCKDCASEVKLKLRKSNTHNKKSLSQAQAKLLLKAIEGTSVISLRDRAIIALSLTTGLRTVEIERANISDLYQGVGCYYLNVQGKGRIQKDETVKVSYKVAELIFHYLDARADFSDDAPLFASTSRNNSKYGERLSAQSVGKMIKRAMKSVGIDDKQITAHSCRHFAATTAIKAGVDLREVSAMLRHSNVNITMTYLHDLNLEQRQAEMAVSDSLFGEEKLDRKIVYNELSFW